MTPPRLPGEDRTRLTELSGTAVFGFFSALFSDAMAARSHPRARLPAPVRPGDRVGVAALSGPVDPDRLARGMAALRDLGFEPVPAYNLERTAEQGLFAGSDGERLEAFHRLAADPSLAAIIFARGGHGVLRVLSGIDWPLLARRPRAYVGYSDLTPFLLEIVRRLGVVAFHGPMVAADLARGLTAAERRSFLDSLAGRFPQELPLAGVLPGAGPDPVEGPLLGGCLSLLTSTLATPWAVDPVDALLFWEDVDEPLYRVDRMLTQLALSNALSEIRAMILGHVGLPEAAPGAVEAETVSEEAGHGSGDGEDFEPRRSRLVTWLGEGPAGRLGCPVAWGLEAGHRAPNRTLPLGLTARLEPQRRRLVLLCDPA
jgi:muramoyltetrapeptide carboxypeptidase